MQRFDANGDGTLDPSEKAKAQELRERFGKGRGDRHGGPGQGEPGFGGPAQFGPPAEGNQSGNPMDNFGGFRGKSRSNVAGDWSSKKQERQQKLMQRFDANGDGSLDASEKAERDQFVSEMKQRHQQRRQQKNAGTTQ
jgi:hypothetical protein